jgi:hypothetical protein
MIPSIIDWLIQTIAIKNVMGHVQTIATFVEVMMVFLLQNT